MRKICLIILCFTSFLTATLAFAETAAKPGNYYSSIRPKTGLAAKALAPTTSINILNFSSDIIYASVTNSSIYDAVAPGQTDYYIFRDNYYGSTPITLNDPWHRTFFSQYVCRLARVIVEGNVGAYHVRIDNTLC